MYYYQAVCLPNQEILRETMTRKNNELRAIKFTRGFTDYAAGSVLVEMGDTRVLCTASFENSVPQWRKDSGLGWLTAEYSMLPSSTLSRKARPRSGSTDSRGIEIQRLIGRVLRCAVDYEKLGENTITIDCDVLQADGGTRTAAINGGYVALVDAVNYGLKNGFIKTNPLTCAVAAVSVGIFNNKTVLDLDYNLDSQAEVDMNLAMNDKGEYIEIQGTGERITFSPKQLESMLQLGRKGIKEIMTAQQAALAKRLKRKITK